MAGGPEMLRFETAAERLRGAIQALRTAGRAHPAVGVTGPVGAGKTTLANLLAGGSHVLISTDNYLPDYDLVPYLERDNPAHADLALLAANLADLRQGRAAMVPEWSFRTHRRESLRRVEPGGGGTIIVEGIHALHPPVREHVDLAVYVEASAEVRWRRWEQLELTGQRGWGVAHAREHFEQVAEPWFARFAAVYRAGADFVVSNG